MTPHLLMVDDEAPTRELYSLYLETRGFKVCTASNPQEALALVEEKDFQVVLLDMALGESSGLDLIEPIKRIDPKLPILIYTGRNFDEALREQALAKGAAGFLSKAQPLDQLMTEINNRIKA